MTAALIVIEIAAPNVSDDALAVLVSACTRAAREAECVLTKNASDEQPSAVAIVSLQAGDRMRVEVGVHQGDHDAWRTKDFSFLAADDSMDRWRAVGFAIGTLAESNPPPVEDATAPEPSPAEEHPVLREPAAVPAPTRPKHLPSDPVFVGAQVIFGQGLDSGPWRLGSAVYADFAAPRWPVFFTFGGSAATRVSSDWSGATVRWFDLSAGAGVPLLGPVQGSGLEFRALLLGEYFDVSASALGRSETMTRWTVGLQGAFGGRLKVAPDLFLTADVQAAGLSGATEVSVAGTPIGNAASFRFLGSLGLRVRLR